MRRLLNRIVAWFSIKDRAMHMKAGVALSILWLILFEVIGINGRAAGYFMNLGLTLSCALSWEFLRFRNLAIWKKLNYDVSRPDGSDVLATMSLSWIIPLINFSYAYYE